MGGGNAVATRQEGDTGLIDIASVGDRLGVSVRYVRRLVAERRIPYVKVGHLLRFDPAEVDEWIDRARVSAFLTGATRRRRRAS
jgi:excisionase family DNA binding protein